MKSFVIRETYSTLRKQKIGQENVAEIRSNVLTSRMRTERHRHNLYSMRTAQSDNDHQTIYDLTQDPHICTYSFLTPTISQLVICCVVYILIIVLFSVKVKQRHLFSKSGLNECKCTGYKTEVELSQHLRNQQN